MDNEFPPDGVSQNDMYITSLPLPPAIHILPAFQGERCFFGAPENFPSNAPGFLRVLDWSPLYVKPIAGDWNYKDRRKAQLILPFLFIGPLSTARDHCFLQEQSITMILVIRHKHGLVGSNWLPVAVSTVEGRSIEVHAFEVGDAQGLVPVFPEANKRINNHLSTLDAPNIQSVGKHKVPGAVLVVCESGNQRAPAVAAAYMMDVLQRDLLESLQYITARRFCTNLDEPLKCALQAYQDIVEAKRDVSNAVLSANVIDSDSNNLPQTANTPPRSSLKRTFDQTDDDIQRLDSDNCILDPSVSPENRTFAPFGD